MHECDYSSAVETTSRIGLVYMYIILLRNMLKQELRDSRVNSGADTFNCSFIVLWRDMDHILLN